MELNTAQVNIRDLVAQVKSGHKNKADAFKELQNILKSTVGSDGSSTVPEELEGAGGVQGADGASIQSSLGGRISQEDRRLLINKLIEQKRQARASESREHDPEAEAEDEVKGGAEQHYATDESGHYLDGGNDHYQEWGASSDSGMLGASSDSAQRPRSASSGRGQGAYVAGVNDSYFTRRSADDSGIGFKSNSRSNRIAQTEAAIRQEMFKDCTFRPKIKTLPRSYVQKQDDSVFYDRVTRWQKEKEQNASQRQSMTESSNVVECTFAPKINRNSLKAVKEIRGDNKEDTANRLYKNHELSILQRSKYIEEELNRERVLEIEECTFNPNISISNTERFAQVRAKVSANPKIRKVEPSLRPDTKECTFTPVVKGVGKHMNSAQVYVSSNVVDRLTRPLVQAEQTMGMSMNDTVGGPVMDMASFMGALNSSGVSSASVRAAQRNGDSEGDSPPSKVLDKKSLENFLGRQEQCAIRREKNLFDVKTAATSKFQPKLCKKSAELIDRHPKGSFLERVERDVLRRADHEIRTAVVPDESCTFQPSITQKSEKLRARTVYEMSRGDLIKREANNRIMRTRSDEEELKEMTFTPSITKKAKAINQISLAKDTAKFLEMAKEKAEKKEAQRQLALQDRDKKEFDLCTFTPETRDCPAYVRRIAKSMAVVRASKSSPAQDLLETGSDKPTWK